MNDTDSILGDFADATAIVGVGLIGGSIAAALRKRDFSGEVIGVGRNPARLEAAAEQGLIDGYSLSPSEVSAGFWVICTPVDRIIETARSIPPSSEGTILVTDAGSVKAEICDSLSAGLQAGVEFIGSHPLAGSEQQGFEHANADLYENRTCVITPKDSATPTSLNRLRNFWTFLGMRVLEMSPEDHDRALATTSHLPHAAAAGLMHVLDEKDQSLAATGFADTTRIAAGDPDLWTAIFLQNAEQVAEAISTFSVRIEEFQQALINRDASAIRQFLADAKRKRDRL